MAVIIIIVIVMKMKIRVVFLRFLLFKIEEGFKLRLEVERGYCCRRRVGLVF